MSTFDEAVHSWTNTINEWYAINATAVEVNQAFMLLKEYRDAQDEPGEIPYVNTFFKDRDETWSTGLDTVDREHLAGLVENIRKH
jgi:hypothetical protein